MSDATATIDRPTTKITTPDGTYIWQDLFTTDQVAAESFYAQLFGWKINVMPIPVSYTHLTLPTKRIV